MYACMYLCNMCGGGMKLTARFDLFPRIKLSGAMPLVPHMSL